MIIGYALQSTTDHNLDAERDALRAAGAERIFENKGTGKARQRTELEKLPAQLHAGDVLVVTKYDRGPVHLEQDRQRPHHGVPGPRAA